MTTTDSAGADRPHWAHRMQAERKARGWTQRQAIEALRAHCDDVLPDDVHLLRMWKNWEAGKHFPKRYKQTIAAAFGSPSAAFFGPTTNGTPTKRTGLVIPTADETLELVERLRRSDVSPSTLDTLSLTVERLCSDYSSEPSEPLRVEGLRWLAELNRVLDSRLTLQQHRDVLVLAGWLALLVGCVEYDMKMTGQAETTRRVAMQIAQEAGHPEIEAWAHEMRSWFALTQGNYREVIEAARQGRAVAPHRSVAVQLAAQEAKAWARIGDRRHVELALDQGRTILESLPYPDNVKNHFTVDPDKFDFYAMDCYRKVGEDSLATLHATEVVHKSTAPDGTIRTPMRLAEAKITFAVAAAREGDLEQAVTVGNDALDIPRQSVPSLVLVGSDLATELNRRHHHDEAAAPFLNRFADLLAVRD